MQSLRGPQRPQRERCFILLEPFVNFYPGGLKFETNDGLFPPSKPSFGMIATQIFTFGPVRWTLSDTRLAWNSTRMRISVLLCEGCVSLVPSWSCVWGLISGHSLWWIMEGRRPQKSFSPNLFSLHWPPPSALGWLWPSAPRVVYVVRAQTEKGGQVVKDMPNTEPCCLQTIRRCFIH